MTVHRRLSAPPKVVWRAWTEPDLMKLWFGSDPVGKGVSAQADLRVGGSFEVTFRNSDGTEFTPSGRYLEVEPFRRLVFTWIWKDKPDAEERISVEFHPEDRETRMVFDHSQIDPATSHNYEVGWNTCFDKLARVVDSLRPVR